MMDEKDREIQELRRQVESTKIEPVRRPSSKQRKEKTMSDYIDRQAAIDAIKGLPTWWADEGGYYGGAQPPMEALLDPEDAVSAIENLPSAQPERLISLAEYKEGE